jgi:Methyltransferase domain
MKAVIEVLHSFWYQPRLSLHLLRRLPMTLSGFAVCQNWESSSEERTSSNLYEKGALDNSSNPLKFYFDSHREGRGIWKWTHYFDIYHHHFSKFVGREVHVLEIGIYSGGSLDMWKHYFGPKCRVYGVDIQEACKVYEDNYTKVFVGDQADREFWKHFKKEVPAIDILIDDGGHLPEQQITTLEEMLPHLRSGGIYLCEDVHGNLNEFTAYVNGLTNNLNAFVKITELYDKSVQLSCTPTHFQSAIHSIHFYPFLTVIEKADSPVTQFVAPKYGTEWQPFIP